MKLKEILEISFHKNWTNVFHKIGLPNDKVGLPVLTDFGNWGGKKADNWNSEENRRKTTQII